MDCESVMIKNVFWGISITSWRAYTIDQHSKVKDKAKWGIISENLMLYSGIKIEKLADRLDTDPFVKIRQEFKLTSDSRFN